MPYTYEYPRPMFTVDAVVMAVRDARLEVLLVRRKHDPFGGCWAMPGGFVDMDETLEAAVARELEEETGLSGIRLTQMHTFGDPGRDPRGRAISTAYLALVDPARHTPRAADDADAAQWLPVAEARGLAFDHDKMVACGWERLRYIADHAGLGAQILPERFRLDALRGIYEAVEGRPLDARSFESLMRSRGIVEPAGEGEDNAQLYRFAPGRVAPI